MIDESTSLSEATCEEHEWNDSMVWSVVARSLVGLWSNVIDGCEKHRWSPLFARIDQAVGALIGSGCVHVAEFLASVSGLFDEFRCDFRMQ